MLAPTGNVGQEKETPMACAEARSPETHIEYEAVEKKKPSGDPADYDIRIKGSGPGTGRTATVYGRFGSNAKETADIIVEALNKSLISRQT